MAKERFFRLIYQDFRQDFFYENFSTNITKIQRRRRKRRNNLNLGEITSYTFHCCLIHLSIRCALKDIFLNKQ